MAIISGKNLIRSEQKPNQLFIFKRIINKKPKDRQGTLLGTISNALQKHAEGIHYEQVYKVVLKDIPIFNKVSMKFMF